MRGRGSIKVATAVGLALGVFLVAPGPAQAATIKVGSSVDSITDDDVCSLREALISANKNVSRDSCERGESDRDTVKLPGGGIPQQFLLTGSAPEEDQSKEGDLDYTGGGPLTIVGKGEDETLLNATLMDNRVIHATKNARSLTLKDLSIFNGTAPAENPLGGNVLVDSGALTLDRVTVDGGAAVNGGGVRFTATEKARRDLTVRRSVFNENSAEDGGGLALNALSGVTRITRSSFTGNAAESDSLTQGGAIASSSTKTLISDSFFAENRTEATNNSGTAATGGAVALSGSYEKSRIDRSLFQQNVAVRTGVSSAEGGAVYSAGLKTRIVNSTFYDNESEELGGAVHGRADVAHSTFLSNHADEEGDHVSATGFPITLRNSILPGAAIAVDVCADSPDAVSKGFNVFSYDDPHCGTLDSDVVTGGSTGLASDPADNGGPTSTIAIAPDSPARNLIPKEKCRPAKGVDQRGYERPAGKRCDAGAFERGARP